jgi:lambda family phage portal protein
MADALVRLDLPRKPTPRAAPPAPVGRSYFAGAAFGRTTADWWPGQVSADRTVKANALALRNRARDLVLNWPYARRFCQLLAANVVGPDGVRLVPRVKYSAGPKNGEFDPRVNDAIRAGWDEWCEAPTCTVDGRYSFLEVLHLWAHTEPTDGEFLVRMVSGFDNPFGFALQVLDADQLDVQYDGEYQGREVRMGVEIDAWGRAVAFHFLTSHPSEAYRRGTVPYRLRVPAADVIYLGRLDRPGQTRAVTWFHSILLTSRMLEGFTEAYLTKARLSASTCGVITQDPEHVVGEAPGPLPETFNAEPGVMYRGAPGETISTFDTDTPNGVFGDFVKAVLREVSAGLGVSYASLAADLSDANYSSMRSGKLAEQDEWKLLQRRLVDRLCRPVFARWLEMATMTGAVTLPSADWRQYLPAMHWQARMWPWVDPRADLEAAALEISLGLNSRTRLAESQGREIDDVFADLDRENQKAVEYGIDISGPKAGAPPAQPDPADATAKDSTATGGGNSEDAARRRLLKMVRSQQ